MFYSKSDPHVFTCGLFLLYLIKQKLFDMTRIEFTEEQEKALVKYLTKLIVRKRFSGK